MKKHWLPLALAAASFLLYLRTLAPNVVEADGGEFQFAAWNFSFVHPTGYPLYLILGGLFQHLVPLGNPAYRLNLFTALTAALAVAAVYLAAHAMTRRRLPALVAAASFALTRTFWYDASAAEVYDLNALFLAVLIWLALRWQAQPSVTRLSAFFLMAGLSLTHHRSIILWLPAFLLFFVLTGFPNLQSQISNLKSSLLVVTCQLLLVFLAPLLLYLYIPLRAPSSPYATLPVDAGHVIQVFDSSPAGTVNYFLGRGFQFELGWDSVSAARLASAPGGLFDEFLPVGIVLGAVGFLVLAARRNWALYALLTLGAIATVAFALVYHIGDFVHYYIPLYLVWALWIGIGYDALIQVSRIRFSLDRRALATVGVLIAAVLLLPQLLVNGSFADRSHETGPRDRWTRLLASGVPDNAILISNDRDEMMPLWYMQYVENTRRDVLGLFPLITPASEHADIVRLTDGMLNMSRPVFFIKPMPGLEVRYDLDVSPAPLVRVLGLSVAAPPRFPANATLAESVRVLGYDLSREQGALRVAVHWQAVEKLTTDYSTFVQVIDPGGRKIAQGNDHQVGGDFYPTSMWRVGTVLLDEQVVPLPADLKPGEYHLLVGMYRQPDMEHLGDPVDLGPFSLQ